MVGHCREIRKAVSGAATFRRCASLLQRGRREEGKYKELVGGGVGKGRRGAREEKDSGTRSGLTN